MHVISDFIASTKIGGLLIKQQKTEKDVFHRTCSLMTVPLEHKSVRTRGENGKTRGETGIQEAQFAFPVAMFPFTPLGIAT